MFGPCGQDSNLGIVTMTKKSYSVVVMDGDGIGPEVVHEALRVLDAAAEKFHFRLDYRHVPAGDASLQQFGDALPEKRVEAFASSDACLKGPDRKSTRLNSSHSQISYAVFCLKKTKLGSSSSVIGTTCAPGAKVRQTGPSND